MKDTHPTPMEIIKKYLEETKYVLLLDDSLKILPSGGYNPRTYRRYLNREIKKIRNIIWDDIKPKDPLTEELLLIIFNTQIDWDEIASEQLFKRRSLK